MPDPDLEIRGGGGGVGGGVVSKKKNVWPFGPKFGLKISGGTGEGCSPGSATEYKCGISRLGISN